MATLRDLIGVNTDTGLADEIQEQNFANGMGSLRRGWESGRIGNELNPMLTEELDAQIAGDAVKATSLRGNIDALRKRQQIYAPEVGKLEDIHGVGDTFSWAGGQIGQGAASMLDPMAVSAGLNIAGRVAGAIPTAPTRALGWAAQAAALGIPALMSKRQLTGEFIGEAGQDQELMARTSPQELRDMAGNYGAIAAIPDSFLPGMVGRQVAGLGAKTVGRAAMGPMSKMMLANAGEGLTEGAQAAGSQYARGLLNPNRDTSGDFMDVVNNAAGGFVGGSPYSAVGAYTEAGHRRVENTAERLGTAAGQGFDLLSEKAAPYVDQAKEAGSKWWKRGSEAATDLATGEDGKVSGQALVDNLKTGAQDAAATFSMPKEERSILSGVLPPELENDKTPAGIEKGGAWLRENDVKRAQLVSTKLAELNVKEPEAKLLLDNIEAAGDDADQQMVAVAKGSDFLLKRTDLNQLNDKMNQAGSALGRVSGVAGAALGRGAAVLGKGAFKFGESVVGGVKQGLAKKNMQSFEAHDYNDRVRNRLDDERQAITDSDTFKSWRDRVYGVRGQDAADRALDTRGQIYDTSSNGEPKTPEQVASQKSYRRASMFGEMLATAAQDIPKTPNSDPHISRLFFRDMGYEIAEMADSWAQHAEGKAAPGEQAKRQAPGAIIALDAIANDLRVAHGENADLMLNEMQAMAEPNAAPMFDYLRESMTASATRAGQKSMQERRTNAANQLILMLPTARANEVLRSGILNKDGELVPRTKLDKPGNIELLESLEAFSRGHADPALRKSLEEAVGGREYLNRMLEVVSGIAVPEAKVGTVVDDRAQGKVEENLDPNADDDQVGESSAYEQAAAEKNVVKGSGPKVYGFHSTANLRTDSAQRDPFGAMEAPGEDGVARRPKLFKQGQQLFGGKGDAIAKKIADIKQQMVDDPAYAGHSKEDDFLNHDNHSVTAKSARDVMKDMGMQPGKILQLFRDYAHADYNDEKLSPEERKAAGRLSGLASKTIADTIKMRDSQSKGELSADELAAAAEQTRAAGSLVRGKDAPAGKGGFRTTPAERKEVRSAAGEYFKNRFVVVGEQLSNRDPSKIALTEMLDMHKAGEGLTERARKAGLEGDGAAALSDANILNFKSDAVKGGQVAIPAGKLVNWVRSQRKDGDAKDYSNASKDDAYLSDVMEGIAALIGSGHVQGLPTKENKFGKTESFAQGVAPSLRLATKTFGDKKFGDAKRVEKKGKVSDDEFQGSDQDKVAADQMRQDDYFTPEDREIRDLVVDDKAQSTERRKESNQAVRFRHRNADGAAVGSVAVPQGDRSGTYTADAKTKIDPETGLDRTDKSGYDMTELDHFPKQKEGVAPDDFSDQQFQTKHSIGRFEGGPEPKGTAASSAGFRAGKINEAFLNDPAKGQEMIKQRIRAAMRPEYTENKPEYVDGKQKFTVPGVAGKDQVVGGVHYIAPVAAFINFDNFAKNNIDMSTEAVHAIRTKVANILLKGEISKTEKVKIARLMSQDPARITAMNVDAQLQRLVDGGQPKSTAVAQKKETVTAAPEVAAGLGKPSGGFKLTPRNSFTPKDQGKADRATAYIGRGSPASATNAYAQDAKAQGVPVNSGKYTSSDTVFVSAEGKRVGRVSPDAAEIARAMDAGATIVTDNWQHRDTPHNVGERQVAAQLADGGYAEAKPGLWVPAKDKRHASRIGLLVDRYLMSDSPAAAKLLDAADRALMSLQIERNNGKTREQALMTMGVASHLRSLTLARLADAPYAKDILAAFTMGIDQSYSLNGHVEAEAGMKSRLVAGGAKLSDLMAVIGATTSIPQEFKVIAKAVAKAAGSTPVTTNPVRQMQGANGYFDSVGGNIIIAEPGKAPIVSTVLHEGVHAATVRALDRDIELKKATYALMAHIAARDPELMGAYGMSNISEFMAEGLSNEGLQARLLKIPANKTVAAYLSSTVANAWESFVGLVRKALGLQEGADSALMQLVGLAGRAMTATAVSGKTTVTLEDIADAERDRIVPLRAFEKALNDIAEMPQADRSVRELADELIADARTDGWVSHSAMFKVEMARRVMPTLAADGKFDGDAFSDALAKLSDDIFPVALLPSKNALNAQNGGPSRIATQADMDKVVAEAERMFGKNGVNILFKDITGYSGEFIKATNTIVISTTAAAGTLNTLYHEALHKFFIQFVESNPKLQTVFEDLVDDPKHLARLHALLDGYPAAQAQLVSGEERLAYTYQFWKAGLLQVDAKASTWLQKIGKFFRRVLGRVRQSERALEIFQAFDNGKMSEPSAAGRVIAAALGKGTMSIKMRRQFDGLMQAVAAATMPAAEILLNSVSPKARALSTMLFTNPGDGEHGEKGTGLLNARTTMAKQFINRATSRLESMSETDQAQVQEYLQGEGVIKPNDIPNPEHRRAVQDIRALLDDFYDYMAKAGKKVDKVKNDYYPVVWSADALIDKKDEFIEMLVTHYGHEIMAIAARADTKLRGVPASVRVTRDGATRIWASLVENYGVEAHMMAGREDGVLNPFFASQEHRKFPWIRGEHRRAFLEKDMAATLTRYFSQGTKATEYFRRFGENGTRLDDMLNGTKELGPQGFPVKVNGEYVRDQDGIIHELKMAANEMGRRGELKGLDAQAKWVSRQMRDISMSVGAMEGSLGKDVSPGMRKFNSWMTVYQNVRLLPMSLFSSFVDPLAIVARGAPLQAAYETFTYGLREVFRGWADAFKDMPAERQKDEWRELAEHIGAAEVAMFAHHSSEQYGSVYMSSGARKINDKMFVLNGMESWNRSNRIMATKWATRFLEQHAALPDANHSARWLKELGLTPDMIVLDQGKLVTNKEQLAALKGITVEQAERQLAPIYQALNRWVEGAVLTPNAAQRPAWSSDPNYATMFHLKQFSYSFHQTILKRATNEFKHGNMAPVGALAMFIPTMIGADLIKGLIQGGGSLPPYMAGMTLGDHIISGTQRAGLGGIGVIGTDAIADYSSLGGPAIEQAVDALRDGFGAKTLLQAAPLHGLYKQAVI